VADRSEYAQWCERAWRRPLTDAEALLVDVVCAGLGAPWALYVRPVDEFMDGRFDLEPLKPLRFNMESPPTAAEVDRLRALGIDVRGWYRARLA
jgi:hypothetical protein